MAGRGRGRGRGQLSFSIEAVGIGKGENLPPSTVQPTQLFPPLEHKPVPLQTSEEAEYMLALKQEFRGAMKTLPFYIRPAAPKKDVERYSDKYQSTEPSDNTIEWTPVIPPMRARLLLTKLPVLGTCSSFTSLLAAGSSGTVHSLSVT